MFSRYDIAVAHVMLCRHRGGECPSRAIEDLTTLSAHECSGRYATRETDDLDGLADSELACYFATIAKREGNAAAAKLASDWSRINAVNGVEIRLSNSDGDPTQITFIIQDPIADAWCDRHGALDGGTWECCDGPEFCYDTGHWYPGLLDRLIAEGYDLNFAEYSEPDEDDIAAAEHASECDECDYDHHKAVEHLERLTQVDDAHT